MIEKGIRYKDKKELPTGQLAKTTKEELMYYLSPVYGKEAIKDLDEDQLKELLDELTETFYKVKKKQGGVIKDPTFTKYFSAKKDFTENDWKGRNVLLFGSEGLGIKKNTLTTADFTFKIGISRKIESLNISNAVGIVCHFINLKN